MLKQDNYDLAGIKKDSEDSEENENVVFENVIYYYRTNCNFKFRSLPL